MRSPTIRPLAILSMLLLVAGCSGGSGSSHSPSTTTTGASASKRVSTSPAAYRALAFDGAPAGFYVPPQPMPDVPHGTLLRYERAKLTVAGGTAWKVMYASTSLTGKRIAVTGVVIVPKGDAPAGGWKLVTVAHGTTGIADDCAPSRVDLPRAEQTPNHPVSVVSNDMYHRLPAKGYLTDGYVLAITDYEGLGTPGIHPYLVGQSEGRSVIDAAIAARQLPRVEVGRKYAVWGYSQGGHAAAWANDVAAKWAPDLDLVGTVAGAPPSELNLIANTFATTQQNPSYFFMIVAGYAAAYPQLHPSDILTPAGMKVLSHADDECLALDKATQGKTMSSLVKKSFVHNTTWQAKLGENNPGQPGRPKTKTPLLILHSAADTGVPAFLSKVMFDRMCSIGQTVERRVYHRGKDHDAAVYDVMADGLTWINGRMAGKQPVSTCPKK